MLLISPNILPILTSKSGPYLSHLNLGKTENLAPPSSKESFHFEAWTCDFWHCFRSIIYIIILWMKEKMKLMVQIMK